MSLKRFEEIVSWVYRLAVFEHECLGGITAPGALSFARVVQGSRWVADESSLSTVFTCVSEAYKCLPVFTPHVPLHSSYRSYRSYR